MDKRTLAVAAHIETWSLGELRNFLLKVYAETALPDPPIYTWSLDQTRAIVGAVFLKAHPKGPFPWESTSAEASELTKKPKSISNSEE